MFNVLISCSYQINWSRWLQYVLVIDLLAKFLGQFNFVANSEYTIYLVSYNKICHEIFHKNKYCLMEVTLNMVNKAPAEIHLQLANVPKELQC